MSKCLHEGCLQKSRTEKNDRSEFRSHPTNLGLQYRPSQSLHRRHPPHLDDHQPIHYLSVPKRVCSAQAITPIKVSPSLGIASVTSSLITHRPSGVSRNRGPQNTSSNRWISDAHAAASWIPHSGR